MIRAACIVVGFCLLGLHSVQAIAEPLPSWTRSDARDAIVEFVESVSDPRNEDYVPRVDRIAVFDNDGTLWAEQPVYFQILYALDEFGRRAKSDPALVTSDALEAAAAGDLASVLKHGEEGLLELIDASHSGVSVVEFQANARRWLDETTHPTKGRPFGSLLYLPMLELLAYLRDKGFKTYIVSGGGIDFIRSIAEDAYGIPPEQVVGSMGKLEYRVVNSVPTVVKTEGVVFVDDKVGKPVGIMRHIGKRPIFAGGNSDGDFEMLEWTTTGDGPRFGLLVHHTDAEREWAYDRDGNIGQLVRGLDEGPARGWVIVDMQADWLQIFPQTP